MKSIKSTNEIHSEIHNEICSKSIMKSVLSEIHLKSTKFQLKICWISWNPQNFMKSMAFHRMSSNSTAFCWIKHDFIMDFTVDFFCWFNYQFITNYPGKESPVKSHNEILWNFVDFSEILLFLVQSYWISYEICNEIWWISHEIQQFKWDPSLSPGLSYGIRSILYEIHKIHSEIHNEIHNEICSKSIMKSVLSEIHLKSTKFQLKSAGFHEIHGISQDVI